MSKVYVTQQPRFGIDITEAESFGELVVLCPHGTVPEGNVPLSIVENMRKELAEFSEVDDYLLPVGNASLIVATAMILNELTDTVRMLHWQHVTGQHIPRSAGTCEGCGYVVVNLVL